MSDQPNCLSCKKEGTCELHKKLAAMHDAIDEFKKPLVSDTSRSNHMPHKKSELKEKGSYYYESKPWYEACPKTLPEIPEPKVEIFPRTMTNREILREYKITPYASYAEAAAAIAHIKPTLKNDYKGRLAYFTENGTTYRLGAWRRDDGQLRLGVREAYLDGEWGAENGVAFSNGILGASDMTLRPSESLTLPKELVINGITYIQK